MTTERFHGLAAVLAAIRDQHGITQPALTDSVGVGRSAIAQRVSELTDAGLVAPAGLGPSTGGRAPRRLRLRAEAGHVLAVDVAPASVGVAVADLAGELRRTRREPVLTSDGPEAVLRTAERLGDAVVDEAGVRGSVWAVGIGVPGPVADGRTAKGVALPGWDGHPVRDRLAAHWAAPAWMDTRVNLLALGETSADPSAARARQLLYVGGGTEITAAVFIDGKVYRGAHGLAGALGHVPVPEAGHALCPCGRTGCLEAVIGRAALVRDGRMLAESGQSRALADALRTAGVLRPVDITLAAAQGDAAARALLARTGQLLGASLAGLISFFDPQVLVVGGGLARAGVHLLATLRDEISRRVPAEIAQDLRIEASTLDEEVAGVLGAAHFAVSELFAPQHLQRWLDLRSPAGRPEIAVPGLGLPA